MQVSWRIFVKEFIMNSDGKVLRKAVETDVPAILEYLGRDIPNCLYLYLDVYTYGVTDPNITIWFSEAGGKISLVIMKYYDSFQIYSDREDCDIAAISDMINEYDIGRAFARKDIIEKLSESFNNRYYVEYGKILELNKYRIMKGMERVEQATEEDIPEIVDLILTDEENNASYNSEELAGQMLDRMRTGMGNSYIIREEGKIVAHLSIAAQTDKFRVAALTIVHPDYRNTLYGTMLDSYLINELGKNGMRLFAFMTDERRIKMFLLMGNSLAAEYGKLIKNK